MSSSAWFFSSHLRQGTKTAALRRVLHLGCTPELLVHPRTNTTETGPTAVLAVRSPVSRGGAISEGPWGGIYCRPMEDPNTTNGTTIYGRSIDPCLQPPQLIGQYASPMECLGWIVGGANKQRDFCDCDSCWESQTPRVFRRSVSPTRSTASKQLCAIDFRAKAKELLIVVCFLSPVLENKVQNPPRTARRTSFIHK